MIHSAAPLVVQVAVGVIRQLLFQLSVPEDPTVGHVQGHDLNEDEPSGFRVRSMCPVCPNSIWGSFQEVL